jgi:hypothetical protein
MAQHVFISYASHDKPCAEAICQDLEARDIQCWIAPRDVPLGADYAKSIMEGITEAHAMIVIVSALSNKSVHVPREVERAVSRNIPVLPFRVEAVPLSASLEYFVSSSQWLDASEGRIESHFEELARAVQRMTRGTSATLGRAGTTAYGIEPEVDRRAAKIADKRMKSLSARPNSSSGWGAGLTRMLAFAGALSVLVALGFVAGHFYPISGSAKEHNLAGSIRLQLASANGVPFTPDQGTFLDTQLRAAPNLAWAASASADSPIEARIYDPSGLQVAAGGVRGITKSADGDTSVAGVIPISDSLVQKPGLYKFSLYSGDRELASRSFLIGTDLVAKEHAQEVKAKAEAEKAEADEARARAEEARVRARRAADEIARERETASAQQRARTEQAQQQAQLEQQRQQQLAEQQAAQQAALQAQQQQQAQQQAMQEQQQKSAVLQQFLNIIPRR